MALHGGDTAANHDALLNDPPFVDCQLRPAVSEEGDVRQFRRRRSSDGMYTPDNIPAAAASDSNSRHSLSSKHVADEFRSYFSTRVGAIDTAFEQCKQLLLSSDGSFESCWLLTLIDHWDVEKERVVLLTSCCMCIIKYDFIRLLVEDVQRVSLAVIDKVISGPITYPPLSLTPRISGIASGVVSVLRGCLMGRFQETVGELRRRCVPSSQQQQQQQQNNTAPHSTLSSQRAQINFQPRYRQQYGVRVRWDGGRSVSAAVSWNPLSHHVPFVTLISHPLHQCHSSTTEQQNGLFSVDEFTAALSRLITAEQRRQQRGSSAGVCCVHVHEHIVVENYVGVLSALHNGTNLGFFKQHGKLSF